jgi:hypothetical protein
MLDVERGVSVNETSNIEEGVMGEYRASIGEKIRKGDGGVD